MLRRPLLIALAACVCVAGTFFAPYPLRLPLAVLLVLFLPGAALTELLFGRSSRDGAERLVTILALSISSVVLGGLVLDAAWTITRASVAVLAAGVSIVASLAAALLARKSSRQPPSASPNLRVRVSVRDVVLFAAAAAVVVGAIVYARQPLATARGAKGYTILWINSPPVDAKTKPQVALGVESQELQPMRYLLDVHSGKRRLETWHIALAPGGRKRFVIARPPGGHAVEAVLYVRRADSWAAYRRVRDVE